MSRLRQRLATRHAQHGFSLVELSVAMAVMMVVLAMAFQQLAAAMNQTAQIDRAAASSTSARLLVDSMVSELRQASSEDGSVNTVITASATQVVFYSPDRSEPKRLRKITYQLVNGALLRSEVLSSNSGTSPWTFPTTTPTPRTVLTGLTNTDIFSYFNSSNVATTTLADIRSLTINLEVQSSLSSAVERIFRTGISLRSSR